MASGNLFGKVDDHSEGYMKPAKMFTKKQNQHAGLEESEYGFGNYMKNTELMS
jgi:hypothetical protein